MFQNFIDYWYIRTSKALRQLELQHQKKKAYRLMKKHRLLFRPTPRVVPKREYVESIIPVYYNFFEVIELDIKYIYIKSLKRRAYLIPVIDVFSRAALLWDLSWSMNSEDAVNCKEQIINDWAIALDLNLRELNITIRTNTGFYLIAKKLKNHLELTQIGNGYVRPATP